MFNQISIRYFISRSNGVLTNSVLTVVVYVYKIKRNRTKLSDFFFRDLCPLSILVSTKNRLIQLSERL